MTTTPDGAAVIVSRHQLAAILGVNPDRISEYTAAGLPLIHRGGRGQGASRYDAIACAQWVRRHRPGMLDALQERARKDRAAAEMTELKIAERRGQLIDAAEAERAWSGHVLGARNHLLGLPTRAKARLPHLSHEDVRTIDTLVRESLEELAAGQGGHPMEEDANHA